MLAAAVLQQLAAALQAPAAAGLPGSFMALESSVVTQLAGAWCCAYDSCSNMAGMSDKQLVGGVKCVCGRCRVARFCSRECLEAAWPQHRPVCKRLRS